MSSERQNARQILECFERPLSLVELRDMVLAITRAHWAYPDNHGMLAPSFECAVYDFDKPEASTMRVEPQDSYVEEELRPSGIYVGLGDTEVQKRVIGNFEEFSEDNATRTNVWGAGTIMLLAHVTPSVTMSLKAAESTLAFLSALGPVICTRCNLSQFEPQKIGAAQKLAKSPDRMFRVDAIVRIMFTWSVSVNHESHRLKLLMSEINPTPSYP